MNYYDQIDPLGEDSGDAVCLFCGEPCREGDYYCSKQCKKEDIK